jgi:ABC-2 type transport system ATP-binding protein
VTAAISVRAMRKAYRHVQAVDGIDFDVAEGECFGILGPNGAGKTTIVEILEGYRRRDDGEVAVLGVDPAKADASWRARIGLVLQSSRPNEDLTVSELVRQFAGFYGNPRDPEAVIGLVGLAEKANDRAGKLSGGQQRRLDVALGIVGRPELLFLDEPTTGFDPEARRHFWSLVGDLKKEGTTIVLTTHYLDEAEALADRVAVVAAGKLRALDTPARLGGRDTASATVSWIEGGSVRTEATATPTKLIGELGARLGGEVSGLLVSQPSLEDIYLRLIGADR